MNQVRVISSHLIVNLADGRNVSVLLEWYPRLKNASKKERENWQLLGDAYAIEWPDLDEFIGVEGLPAGRRSGESKKSFEKWLGARVNEPHHPNS